MKKKSQKTKVKIFLDMDGVIADFLAYYIALGDQLNSPVKPPFNDCSRNPELFKIAVSQFGIFEHLPIMPSAMHLISFIEKLEIEYELQVEMLTSVNSKDKLIAGAAKKQKNRWLKSKGVHWKPNFVTTNEEKGGYACDASILIDDSDSCLTSFMANNGIALKYAGFTEEFQNNLRSSIENIIKNKSNNMQ